MLISRETHYHYQVDQDFVENCLWRDADYQIDSFVEFYYDTPHLTYGREKTRGYYCCAKVK